MYYHDNNLNELADMALALFNDGWTKSQLINTLSRRGVKPGKASMVAINTAWNHYENLRKELASEAH